MPMIQVVGLGGSMRSASTSSAALQVALNGAERAGAAARLFDVRKLGLAPYAPDQPASTAARDFADAVADAHAMVWAAPMYHGSVSGSFKNVIDWLQLLAKHDPPYLTDKVIGLVTTAGGTQGLQGVNTMEFIVRALRAWAVPMVLPVARAWEAFDEHGVPRHEDLAAQLTGLGGEVVRAATQMAASGTCDYADHR